MRRRPPRSTLDRSSAASDVYKRQSERCDVTRASTETTVSESPDRVIRATVKLLADEGPSALKVREVAAASGLLSLIHISEPTRPY